MKFCLVDKVVKTSGLDWVELCELECRLSLGLVVPVKTNDLPMLKLANIGGENNVQEKEKQNEDSWECVIE